MEVVGNLLQRASRPALAVAGAAAGVAPLALHLPARFSIVLG